MKITQIPKLESLVEQMRKQLDSLQEKIEKREDFYLDKTEKWQESDKGIDYEEKTGVLQDQFSEFESAIESIEYAIEQLQSLGDFD